MKKNPGKEYDNEFYKLMTNQNFEANNLTSAQEMVPYILKLFPNAASVIDVGCGIGIWASTFKNNGIPIVSGVDGKWVDKTQLLINKNEFHTHNFESGHKYITSRKYDIAICLEVAEHLNSKYADDLLDTLTELSDVIIFSAAIPHQGGIHHVNEQYQSYWKKKFEQRNYTGLDLLRGKFAANKKVATFYSQNTLVYINNEINFPSLQKYYQIPYVVDLISPNMGLIKGSNSWKHLFHVQYLLGHAFIKKLLITFKVIKQQ